MTFALSLPLRPLRLGPFSVSPYGACAAIGLVLGMSLARPAARRLRLQPEQAWDAGIFALLACLLISRLLLVLENLKVFIQYPLLVLSLPSLTLGGMALAAVALSVYLRRRHLPLLLLLDAFAAPGALLAACLEVGHWFDASETGTPSSLPWAVRDPWTAGAERVHPVALYGTLAALGLARILWVFLRRRAARQGRVAALALMLGGLAAFVLAMVSLPTPGPVDLGLEPGQWLAAAALLAGALLWTFAPAFTLASASADGAGTRAEIQPRRAALADPLN